MEEVRDETGWGGARSRWVLAHRMSRFPRRKRRGMVSMALIGRVEDVQDGALWATRRTGSSSRELRGAIGVLGRGRGTIGRDLFPGVFRLDQSLLPDPTATSWWHGKLMGQLWGGQIVKNPCF